MASLNDWLNEIHGNSGLDKSDFYDLIPRDIDDDFLEKAFLGLPNGRMLINKIKLILSENSTSGMYVLPRPENLLSEEEIVKLADAYASKVSHYLRDIGRPDLALHSDVREAKIVRDNKEFIDITRSDEYNYSEINDCISRRWSRGLYSAGEFMFALDEAVNSMTMYPEITRYILQDVVSFPLDGQNYYDLWRGGGDLYFYADFRVLLCPYRA